MKFRPPRPSRACLTMHLVVLVAQLFINLGLSKNIDIIKENVYTKQELLERTSKEMIFKINDLKVIVNEHSAFVNG